LEKTTLITQKKTPESAFISNALVTEAGRNFIVQRGDFRQTLNFSERSRINFEFGVPSEKEKGAFNASCPPAQSDSHKAAEIVFFLFPRS